MDYVEGKIKRGREIGDTRRKKKMGNRDSGVVERGTRGCRLRVD